MLKNLILLLMLQFIITGCDHIQDHFKSHSHEGHTSSGTESLSLDDGKKWKADTSTSNRIRAMKAIIENHKKHGESLSPSEYHAIHMGLNNEMEGLIQGCKMTGRAHDELHIFLGILKNNIDNLHSEDASKSYEAFTDLEKHLNMYNDFFE